MAEPERVETATKNVPLLDVRDLCTYIYTQWGVIKAVDGVSFTLREDETLGLVGESGSGKSMVCLSLLRLPPRPAGRIVGGEVLYQGRDLLQLSEEEMRQYRGRRISMILQDPLSSLNPVFSIGTQVAEPLQVHRLVPESGIKQRVVELLRMVHIPTPQGRVRDYPHQFSGGMRQRVAGAIAMSSEPRLLIADEPTTSLDVTIQVQYLNLLKETQRRSKLAIIFVSHDMGTIGRMCDRVAVMYAGRVVEEAPVDQLFDNPAHPYSEALVSSLPSAEATGDRLPQIQGDPPDMHNLPPGCAFAERCPKVMDICREQYPPIVTVDSPEHTTACWLHVTHQGLSAAIGAADGGSGSAREGEASERM